MNVWFMIWVFFAVVIMGTFMWSIQILMKQKMAWKDFGKKHNLSFDPNGVMASGVLRGVIREHSLTISSDPQIDEDFRGRRFLTTIQIDMNLKMLTEGVIGSAELRRFVESLPLPDEFAPADPEWNKQACVKAQKAEALDDFFSEERTRAINSLMSIKGVNVLLVFNEKTSLLRFESQDPMDDAARLERLVFKILDVIKILESYKTP